MISWSQECQPPSDLWASYVFSSAVLPSWRGIYFGKIITIPEKNLVLYWSEKRKKMPSPLIYV